jgi:hypothetical protein
VAAIREFWSGGLPLGQALWLWGVLGGVVVNLFGTLFALILLTMDISPWLVAALMAAHIPFNLFLLVGVWRSSARPEVSANRRQLTRLFMSAWALLLSVL